MPVPPRLRRRPYARLALGALDMGAAPPHVCLHDTGARAELAGFSAVAQPHILRLTPRPARAVGPSIQLQVVDWQAVAPLDLEASGILTRHVLSLMQLDGQAPAAARARILELARTSLQHFLDAGCAGVRGSAVVRRHAIDGSLIEIRPVRADDPWI
jgi:hypothetical protein